MLSVSLVAPTRSTMKLARLPLAPLKVRLAKVNVPTELRLTRQ